MMRDLQHLSRHCVPARHANDNVLSSASHIERTSLASQNGAVGHLESLKNGANDIQQQLRTDMKD
eukprot:3889498-Amphidinium_carterae.2